jgi:hypothetical protein
MKLMSARVGNQDIADVGFLIDKLGLRTAEQVYGVLERFYPSNQVLPKTMYVIEEFFQE